MVLDLALAVNCGSSSIKFQAFTTDLNVLLSGSASNVQGNSPAKFSFNYIDPHSTSDSLSEKNGKTLDSKASYQDVFEAILDEVTKVLELGEGRILMVAHRIVHGGTATHPIVIHHGDKDEQESLDKMDQVSDFAPLHNHHAMLIVKKCLTALPDASSVLCFDTLFHSTLPDFRYTYAISQPTHPTPVPLRRYGFHGLSFASILEQMAQKLGKKEEDVNLVVAHLGSGGSVCLIQGGKSANTSMGVTPLEGLPGGTRSGSIDASLIFHHTKDCSSTVEWSGRQISKAEFVLNKESGLQALTGTNDFGEITNRAFFSDETYSPEDRSIAEMTYKLYMDRLLLYVSSYISTLLSSPAPLNHLDGLVFSGGIGEHSAQLRKDVLNSLKWIEDFSQSGGGIDEEVNEKSKGSVRCITKEGSKIPGWVVETDEEKKCVKLAWAAVQPK